MFFKSYSRFYIPVTIVNHHLSISVVCSVRNNIVVVDFRNYQFTVRKQLSIVHHYYFS